MKITSAEIIRVKLPLVSPFTTSFGTLTQRETIVIKMSDDNGNFGYGEAPVLSLPLYNSEIPESVIGVMHKVLLPLIFNRELVHPKEINQIFERVRGNEFAKSAVEVAAYDIFGKITQKKLIDVIGGKKKRLLTSATISIHSNPADTLEEADRYVELGMTHLKLKIKPGHDLKHVQAILKVYPQVNLMLDANSSYQLNPKTESIFKNLDKQHLYCIEQPLQPFDLIDHAKLQKSLKTDIALDESVESVYDAQKAVELGSCRLVNIKIARVGGLTNALAINKLCQQSGIKTWVGGMLESPIGFYSNLALATVKNFDYPVDFLGALSYLKDFEKYFQELPYDIHGQYLYPRIKKPGLGLDLNWKFLDRYVVEKQIVKV